MTEYERFGLVFTKTQVYKFGHWYLEARLRYSDFGNICFEFSLECTE
jgi:hypothetical protein